MSEEKHEIEVHLKNGWSIYRIAKQLGRPYNTIKNEIKRGSVSLYHGKVQRYKADEVAKVYLAHRHNCRNQYRLRAMLPIKNIDLPEKLRRNTKAKKVRENKRNLGRSIEERPEIVNF